MSEFLPFFRRFPKPVRGRTHIRHIPDEPHRFVYDTPYREEIEVRTFDEPAGTHATIARFGNHRPHHGPFRCDLHPVPTRDGTRIVVTSLDDGGRQLHLIEQV